MNNENSLSKDVLELFIIIDFKLRGSFALARS